MQPITDPQTNLPRFFHERGQVMKLFLEVVEDRRCNGLGKEVISGAKQMLPTVLGWFHLISQPISARMCKQEKPSALTLQLLQRAGENLSSSVATFNRSIPKSDSALPEPMQKLQTKLTCLVEIAANSQLAIDILLEQVGSDWDRRTHLTAFKQRLEVSRTWMNKYLMSIPCLIEDKSWWHGTGVQFSSELAGCNVRGARALGHLIDELHALLSNGALTPLAIDGIIQSIETRRTALTTEAQKVVAWVRTAANQSAGSGQKKAAGLATQFEVLWSALTYGSAADMVHIAAVVAFPNKQRSATIEKLDRELDLVNYGLRSRFAMPLAALQQRLNELFLRVPQQSTELAQAREAYLSASNWLTTHTPELVNNIPGAANFCPLEVDGIEKASATTLKHGLDVAQKAGSSETKDLFDFIQLLGEVYRASSPELNLVVAAPGDSLRVKAHMDLLYGNLHTRLSQICPIVERFDTLIETIDEVEALKNALKQVASAHIIPDMVATLRYLLETTLTTARRVCVHLPQDDRQTSMVKSLAAQLVVTPVYDAIHQLWHCTALQMAKLRNPEQINKICRPVIDHLYHTVSDLGDKAPGSQVLHQVCFQLGASLAELDSGYELPLHARADAPRTLMSLAHVLWRTQQIAATSAFGKLLVTVETAIATLCQHPGTVLRPEHSEQWKVNGQLADQLFQMLRKHKRDPESAQQFQEDLFDSRHLPAPDTAKILQNALHYITPTTKLETDIKK